MITENVEIKDIVHVSYFVTTDNLSGVYNIVIVDQGTYDSISSKDPHTIYFIS